MEERKVIVIITRDAESRYIGDLGWSEVVWQATGTTCLSISGVNADVQPYIDAVRKVYDERHPAE